jgi:hypothetical protein
VSDTPRTDRAANESIVRVYETSKQLEIELSNALHIQRLLESELAAAKDLAESTGRRQIHVCMFCGMESAAGNTQTERRKP